jgi:hypothetical protein
MQSACHNLPAFEGIMQKAGADFKAADAIYGKTGSETSISMNIARAYPMKAAMGKNPRRVKLKKGLGGLA